MTDITANLGLPVIAAAQAQKHVTHNEALRLLDTLVQLAVLDRDLSAPPGSPNDGERWIVGSSPTGTWAGHADDIAAWQDGAWQFATPQSGWVAFVADEGLLIVWNGSAWGDVATSISAIQNLALLGVGTTADSANPFSAKLNNALWVAKTAAEGGDGDLRYKMSKESAAKTLSLLMQTDFSGRAEIGLTGDDDFHIKVSPDGSTWYEGLTLNRSSGIPAVAGLTATGQVSAPGYRGGLVTLADNAATSIPITGGTSAIVCIASTANISTAPTIILFVRVAGAEAPGKLACLDDSNVAYSTSALSGATGTDGKLTFGSPGDGLLYIENRLGAARNFSYTVLANR
jgi:Protein of unknown function (DUF2793)